VRPWASRALASDFSFIFTHTHNDDDESSVIILFVPITDPKKTKARVVPF
jgi:hypothetical protein